MYKVIVILRPSGGGGYIRGGFRNKMQYTNISAVGEEKFHD
jgi:hypothetical protein